MEVTGFTAERMLAIEEGVIVSGVVDINGHLILTKHDGSTIDLGMVQGIPGNDGTDGTDGTDGADGITDGDQSIAGVKTFTDKLVVAPSTDIVPLIIKRGADPGGGAGQLLDIQNHAGSSLASFDYNGGLSAYTVSSLYGLFTQLDGGKLRISTTTDISTTDLNSLAYSGMFSGANLTHSPDGTASGFFIESIIIDTDTALQRGTYIGANPQIYIRVKSSGTWSAWTKLNAVVTDWTAVSFQNSWVNYGSPYQDCQYRKIGDEVKIRGFVKSGTIALSIFTLPTGFRPPASMNFAVPTANLVSWATGAASAGTAHTHSQTIPSGTAGRMIIGADGSVAVPQGGNAWIDVSCSFSTIA